MNNPPTYEQTACGWGLWCEYVDPAGIMTEQEFDAMPIQEKIALQIACFGDEEAQEGWDDDE